MELTVTGVNAITYPHFHIWDWRVAAYLFLGGLTGGAMVMSSILNYLRTGKNAPAGKGWVCHWRVPVMAPIILSVGMFLLFLDLEAKLHTPWFYLTLQPLSPMSWGSWILIVIYPVLIMYLLAVLPPELRDKVGPLKGWAASFSRYVRGLSALNFIFGVALAIYTGVLISSFVARPFWNSAILPMLFLNSALSCGAALMIVVAVKNEAKLLFTKIDIWLVFSEIIILCLFFYAHFTGSDSARASIMPFFTPTHEFFPYWMSIIALTIAFPLAIILKFLHLKEDHAHEMTGMAKFQMNLSAVLVLIGGLIVRMAFIYAGQLTKLSDMPFS
jgi:protein NrfD